MICIILWQATINIKINNDMFCNITLKIMFFVSKYHIVISIQPAKTAHSSWRCHRAIQPKITCHYKYNCHRCKSIHMISYYALGSLNHAQHNLLMIFLHGKTSKIYIHPLVYTNCNSRSGTRPRSAAVEKWAVLKMTTSRYQMTSTKLRLWALGRQKVMSRKRKAQHIEGNKEN